MIGVPKTIDNDLAGTDFTFGFQTAVQIATDAIDRLHTTAESHNRVMVVEVMGRHAGWIAAYSGLAGGADAILVPERPFDIDQVCAHLRRRHERGSRFSIVVVSEGAHPKDSGPASVEGQTDAFGHARLGGVAVAPQVGRPVAAQQVEVVGGPAQAQPFHRAVRPVVRWMRIREAARGPPAVDGIAPRPGLSRNACPVVCDRAAEGFARLQSIV